MSTGELLVALLFIVGLVCSLTLLVWLRRLIRREDGIRQARANSSPASEQQEHARRD